ncbi:MAG: hypothetical protein H6609_20580 [Ignavibacteriales bacterium]|nr:hypothetical protein [Ignavibacteriales bacterium]
MFYSCDTADPIKYYSVHGTLYYYTPPGYYAHPKDIPVVLDSDTLLSDLNREYIFNNVSEGYHLISVSIAEYEPYTDSFLVSRNEMKNIELKGVKEDYFPPIQLNSVKKFKYTDSNCRSSPYIYIEGEAVWNFYNKRRKVAF